MPSEQLTVTVGDNKTTGEYALAVSGGLFLCDRLIHCNT